MSRSATSEVSPHSELAPEVVQLLQAQSGAQSALALVLVLARLAPELGSLPVERASLELVAVPLALALAHLRRESLLAQPVGVAFGFWS